MLKLESVPATSRKVGDEIRLYDNFNGEPKHFATHYIEKITKKYIVTTDRLGRGDRFHRATGFIVGYHWPHFATVIAPETSK